MTAATLHLMVGLPCSGKTTLARNPERELQAIRLTPDEWQLRLFGDDLSDPDHDWRHSTLEDLMWNIAATSLARGIPVILDYGFWAKIERDDYTARAAALGSTTKIHYLECAPDVLLRRLDIRNELAGVDVFTIPKEHLQAWIKQFEAPEASELRTSAG